MSDLDIINELKTNEINLIKTNDENIKRLLKQEKQSYYIIENNQVVSLNIYKKKIKKAIFIKILKLSHLKYLTLKHTKITEIPNTILAFKQLIILNLSNNKISKIPEGLFQLSELIDLDLEKNYIEEIPKNISKLKDIRSLNLSKNKIQKIPRSLLELDNLFNFNIDNNPLTTEPLSLLKIKRLFLNIPNSLKLEFKSLKFDFERDLSEAIQKIFGFDFSYDIEQQINFLLYIQNRHIDWWEINAITTIMRSELLNSNAILDKNIFYKIFENNREYKQQYQKIINYLIQFKLAFKLNQNQILIPSKLPLKIANYQSELSQYEFHFCYKYKNIKNSFLYQFIVQMEDFIDKSLETAILRNAVFLTYKDCKAMIILEEKEKRILISINKNTINGREFLSNIRREFNKINENIDFEERIPIVNDEGKISDYRDITSLDNSEITSTVPLIITEGKTDWKHLENALKIFNVRGEYKNLENKIEFFKYEKMGMGESRVSNRIEVESFIDRNIQKENKRKILHMFDRDTKYSKDYRDKEFVKPIDKEFKNFLDKKLGKKYEQKSKKYKEIKEKLDQGFYSDIDEEFHNILTGEEYKEWKRLSNSNVYVFCIPKINDEPDEICIEFYYKQDEVKKAFDNGRRLFYGSEFDRDSKSYCKKYMTTKPYPKPLDILDGGDKKEVYLIDDEKKQNIALSKNEFTQNILDGVEGFDNFDIENFRLIFDVIEKIVND
jgi:hypothetical protein